MYKRKILFAVFSGFLTVFLPAAQLQDLPEVLGTWKNFQVTRNMAAKDLLPFLPEYNYSQQPPELEKLVHKAVDNLVFRHILEEKLKEQNIAVNRETAKSYIEGQQLFPLSAANKKLTAQLDKLAGQADFQFKAALHCYFVWVSPELVLIKKEEVERFYRLNRKLYKKPDEYDLDVLKLPKSKTAAADLETAEALLRQGEDFESVSKRFHNQSKDGEALPQEALEAFPNMKEGEIMRCEDKDFLYLIQLDKRLPGALAPLEDVAPFIAINLNSSKVSRAAELLLTDEISRCPVNYTPLWPEKPGTTNTHQ